MNLSTLASPRVLRWGLTAALAFTALAGCGGSDPAQGPQTPAAVQVHPFTADVGEIYEFERVVNGITRTCLVFTAGRGAGGLHCFDERVSQ